MGILENKVAVITGSSRGLGLAIARAYAAEGAAVVITARSASTVEQSVALLRNEGFKASGITSDVSVLEQVQALADYARATFNGLDIWVNNAGVAGAYGPTADIPVTDYERVLKTNIFGTYYGSIVALKHFLPQQHGKLINLLGRGDSGPVKFQNAYAPSKAWVRSFTLALAQEYADKGIGIFAFNPGLVETDMMQQVSAIQGYESRLQPLKTIMRMWGNPPEVPAKKALWLASSATDGKTGLNVQVLRFPRIATGALKEGLRRLTGRNVEDLPLDVTSIPSALL